MLRAPTEEISWMRALVFVLSLAALACSAGSNGSGGSGKFEITHLREGTGSSPTATSTVKVHYHGTFPDGRVFDSSVERGEPISFPLDQVIPCWTQGLQQMKVGGKAKLVCPPDMAYGPEGRPPTIPRNATLQFEVELLGIE
jgi:FKBP-type peptidyl-prolyl cis-trans isomerase FkpA